MIKLLKYTTLLIKKLFLYPRSKLNLTLKT